MVLFSDLTDSDFSPYCVSVAMSEREKLVKSTKRDLRSVLLAAKDGIPMQNLNSEFAKEVFSPIPHQRLG